MIEQSIEIGAKRPPIPAYITLRQHYGKHRAGCLRREILMRKRNQNAERHVRESRGVRVYVALLKKTDPYKNSKTEREFKRLGKDGTTWPKPR